LRFASHKDLCEHFGLHEQCSIVVCGTDEDPPLERWWSAAQTRVAALSGLSGLGIIAFTTPNFSVFRGSPRWDNLHSIKRIAQTWYEMAQTGVPTALHANMRTDADCKNWRDFLQDHREIDAIAYEFATGAAGARRGVQHASWLKDLADGVGRPLNLLTRGGLPMFGTLRSSFGAVVLLDSTTHVMSTPVENGTHHRLKTEHGAGAEP
jgi:hypothetical protein